MNAIVFQEMREARGLAYSASAGISQPAYIGAPYSYYAFIASQNDKMQAAIEAFDEIIEDMPQSEKAFAIAKEAILSSIRTSRTIGDRAIWSYFGDRELGLTAPRNKAIFEQVQTMTLDDVVATQQQWAASRDYIYCVLGDIPTLDVQFLKTLGPVEVVTMSEIFGY